MIRVEGNKLLDRSIIRPSKFLRETQVLCVREMDGTLQLGVDRRRLKNLLVPDSDGLGDMRSIVSALRGKQYFTQLDLSNGFHQVSLAEKNKSKTAFRDPDGRVWEFKRAGFGLVPLSATSTRVFK